MIQTAHRVAAGIVAAMAILSATDVLPPWATAAAAIAAVLAHAVEAGIDGARNDNGGSQ